MLLQKEQWELMAAQTAAERSRQHTEYRKEQLSHMVTYAETSLCRRQIILKHFGDNGSAHAQTCCDNCEGKKPRVYGDIQQPELQQDTNAALVILCAVQQLKMSIGGKRLAKILNGSTAADIVNSRYDKNSYYGKLEALSIEKIQGVINHLVEIGYLKVIGGDYPILALTPRGEAAIKQQEKIVAEPPKQTKTVEIPACSSMIRDIGTIVALGKANSPSAVPALIATLRSPDGNARRLSASALGKVRDARAVGPLIQMLAVEKKPQVRQYAVKALGSIADPRALDVLSKISEDKNEMDYTRSAAVSAISECCKAKPLGQETINPPSVRSVPTTPPAASQSSTAPESDPITNYLSSFRPRVIKGIWRTGFALDFHSGYAGIDWNRSAIGELVYRLKYQSDPAVLPALIGFTFQLFVMHPELNLFDTIIPVPSSTPRTFQPVDAFCSALAQTCGRKLQPSIAKARQTKPQKEMHTLSQKRQNVAGAFALKSDITGRKILLIDDLFDSGATLEEITRLLMKHHAAHVNVLTLTRTIHSDE
jgi:hypothetical protein